MTYLFLTKDSSDKLKKLQIPIRNIFLVKVNSSYFYLLVFGFSRSNSPLEKKSWYLDAPLSIPHGEWWT